MSYTLTDPDNYNPETSSLASTSTTATSSSEQSTKKKKPWSKFKSSIKSIGDKMSSKPKFTDSTESSEQKRVKKGKKGKTGSSGELKTSTSEEAPRAKSPTKNLMKKLSVEGLSTAFVGYQPASVSPGPKSYARALHKSGSTSESNLSASDMDTPKKSLTLDRNVKLAQESPDSGRASQTMDSLEGSRPPSQIKEVASDVSVDSDYASPMHGLEEEVLDKLVTKTEQFAQSLVSPGKENNSESVEFLKAETVKPPSNVTSKSEPVKETKEKTDQVPDPAGETKVGNEDVDGRKRKNNNRESKKEDSSLGFIKSEKSVEPVSPLDSKTTTPEKGAKKPEKIDSSKDSSNKSDSNKESKKVATSDKGPDSKPGKIDDSKDSSNKSHSTNKESKQAATSDKGPDSKPEKIDNSKDSSNKSDSTNKESKQAATSDKGPDPKPEKIDSSKDSSNKSDSTNKESKQAATSDKGPDSKPEKIDSSKDSSNKSDPTNKESKQAANSEIKSTSVTSEKKSDEKLDKPESKPESKSETVTNVKPDKPSTPKDEKTVKKDDPQKTAQTKSDEAEKVALSKTPTKDAPPLTDPQTGMSVEEKLQAFLSMEGWSGTVKEATAKSGDGSVQPDKRECLYKILVIGELGTGKTSIIKRYVHQFFSQHYRATIGVDFALKVLNWDSNTIIRLQLWDIAGQERFGNMTRVYYKEAVGAFIVFDVTRSATFDAVLKWKQDLDSKVQLADGSHIPCVLLANKCDQQKEGIVNTPAKMDEYCKENNFSGWFETSAKENINIEEAAKSLVTQILQNDKSSQNGRDSGRDGKFPLDGKSEQESKSCAC